MLRKRLFFILIGLITLVFGLSQAQETQPVFRIGVIDDVRGSISNGARLAVKEINENGGVTGAEGTVFRLELVIQPPQDILNLTEAINTINEARVIAVLGPQTTEAVLNNLPALQALNVPILTPAIGDTVIASDSAQLLFRIRAAERLLGNALASYLTNALQVQQITTIQLDRNSTAGRVGFSVALGQISSPIQETTLLLEGDTTLNDLVVEVVTASPQVTVVYGPPDVAAAFYNQLRTAGYFGIFAYPDARHPDFQNNIDLTALQGILGTTTWPISASDAASNAFVDAFVRGYGDVPDPIAAAAYDAIYLIAEAIGEPGDLLTNLNTLRNVDGVQGVLNQSGLVRGEISDTVAVYQLNSLGGPDVVARYAATQPIALDSPPENTDDTVERTPTATATPDGVVITIESAVQNVRTGPGLQYDVLGQLRQGEQAVVIGANVDFSWVVIQYRGQQGWLATFLLDVFGDRRSVPVITPPPTPTPPPATATPTPAPLADIVIIGASPANLTLGIPSVINVTVRNAGASNAGPFAIAATFPPDNTFASAIVDGLLAGTETIVQLPITLTTTTGNYSVAIVADLNNQVDEGTAGEANNNVFAFNYKVDNQLILINNTTLAAGNNIDLEGNITPQFDLQYTGAGLNTTSNCTQTANCIGLLPGLSWDAAHYGAITFSNGISGTFIDNASLIPGATIGMLTTEGRRAVLRVDAINPGQSITFTYRVYQ